MRDLAGHLLRAKNAGVTLRPPKVSTQEKILVKVLV
jgi:hypothetical protein